MTIKKRLICLALAFTMLATMAPWSSLTAAASFTGALQFDANGKFTVMQLTDIQDNSSVDARIIQVITKAIARYNPDLIVFTGDNHAGSISVSAFQSSVNQFLAPLISTGTKFAVTFGNHDNDKLPVIGTNAGTLTEQYDYFKSRGGSIFVDHDVAALDGVGSGVIPIYANGQSSGTPVYQIYLMDSNDSPSSGSYDNPYTSQIDYYIQRSQTYPMVPSLWFQHVIVPDIYAEAMTIDAGGKTGGAAPFSSNKWTLSPAFINWSRSSSTVFDDIYREGPCSADKSLYETAAHRSSAAYGSKTLYEAWDSYGNLKGAYFGHDHLNEFTVTTNDGIDLGYGESTGLLALYKDDNPGVSVYELSVDGSYSTEFSAETDLAKAMVKFDPFGGTGTMKSQLIVKNSSAPLNPNTFTRAGYTFAGWSTTAGGMVEYGNAATYTAGSDDVVLYAKWILNGNSYNITFDANGGTGGTGPTPMQAGSALTAPVVTRAGYTFTGWSPSVPATVPSVNTTYTAQWSINSYTITFNANGGTGGSSAVMQYGAPLTAPSVTRPGYTFTGWSPAVPATVPAADTTYIAQWGMNTYAITFNANGGTGGTGPTQMQEGMALTAPVVTRTGYTFTGWSPAVPATVPAANTTYTAQWSINSYTIAFNANGGTGGTSSSMQYGAVLTAPVVTRTGYTFTGWSPSVPATVPAANTTYNAQWSINSYTIVFNANGGTGGTSGSMQYSAPLNAPTVTRTGYTFTGWSPEVPASVPAANTTYTAQWSINSYLITFDANGGAGGSAASMQYGAALTPPAVTKPGYTFTGWSPSVPGTVPAADSTYIAQWSGITYTVTFDANGGTGGTGPTPMQAGDSLVPPAVTKTGYTLTGWSPSLPATMPAENMVYFAQWSINSYSITFNANGGTGGKAEMLEYDAALAAPAVTRPGYTFTGWSPSVPQTVPAEDAVYTAQWSINSYTITFNANGGMGGSSLLRQFGTSLSAPVVTRAGYTFAGWSPSVPATVPPANTVYYAQWSPEIYLITFDANGGTGGTIEPMPFGADLTPPNVARTGYTFLGWQPIPESVPAADTTYTAQWSLNSYTITFDANGGTGGTVSVLNYATALPVPSVTREGYVFAGWTPEVPATVPAGNITYVAQWETNKFAIVFDANGGTGGTSGLYAYGDTIAAPQVTRTGYSFTGWTPAVPATAPAANTTYTAQWSINSYLITFDANGGTGGSIGTMVFGSSLNAPPVSRTGYVLTGWTPAVPAMVPAFNATYVAVWTAANYLITFDANGGVGGTSASMAYGSAISAPAVTKFGYNLAGWSPALPASVPAENTIYRAVWVAKNFTITFDANGGTGGTSGPMLYETSLAAPSVSRVGYTFTGWTPSVPATVPAANVTYTAQWSANSYTISFDANGGTGSESAVMVCGSPLTAPVVTKNGYTFTGWSPSLPATVPPQNTTYTAQWNPNSYTITFNANGGNGGMSGLQFCGAALNVPLVTKEGHTLIGWSPALPTTVPAGNAAYTAQWSANSYLIVFDANGGTGGTSGLAVYASDLSAPAVAKEGHSFAGWSPSVPATVPAGSMTYTAQWNVNSYTVTFNANGGTGGTSVTLAYGSVISAPAVSKLGYILSGWSPSLPATMPAQTLNLTAVWVPAVYDAIFKVGSVEYKRVPTAYGAAIVPPANPEKPGNIFLGWDPGLPSSMPDYNLTFMAKWFTLSFKVSFNLNGGTGTVPAPQTAECGSAVILPSQGGISKPGYVFLGWAPTAGSAVPIESYSIPAANATLYAVWGLQPILAAKAGSTTVINTANNFIYGLEAGISKNNFENSFVHIFGNARLSYIPASGNIGTGTKVELIDNTTGTVLQTYVIIIFGDVSGDGNIDSIDAGILVDVENYYLQWDPAGDAGYLTAGDVNGDGNVDSIDAGVMVDYENYKKGINQLTGLAF